jgi:hypothetical protein
MIELHRPLIWYPCGFGELWHRMPSILKECHRGPVAHIEKVVPERGIPDGGHERRAEHAVSL